MPSVSSGITQFRPLVCTFVFRFLVFCVFFRPNSDLTFDRSKNIFFDVFCDFGWPRRRFLAIFCPKTGARRLLFRCFLENGDFVKIVLLLVVGTRFCRVGPFKNRSGERVRTTPAREHDKKCLWRRLRTHFFVPGHVFGHFWDALGSQNGRLWADFRPTFAAFWATVG